MRRFWFPFVFLALPILGPALFAMVKGDMPTLFFEKLFFKSLTLYGLAVVAWLVVVHIVPRIESPSKRPKAILVAGIVSLPIFLVALFLWLESVDIHALKSNVTVASVSELKVQWERPWGERPLGIFVHGKLKGPAAEAKPEVLTHYSYRRGGPASYFPLTLPLILPTGEEIEISCIQNVAGAVNWPETDQSYSVGLKEGDPVAVWGEPAEFEAMGNGEKSYGLGGVKAILYGSPGELLTAFVEPAARSSRPIGWMALVVALLSWVPLAAAWKLSGKD